MSFFCFEFPSSHFRARYNVIRRCLLLAGSTAVQPSTNQVSTIPFMSPTLPIEILKLILVHLSEDRDTLKSSALVCQSWLPDARNFLFHSLTVNSSSNYTQIFSILAASPSGFRNLDLTLSHYDILMRGSMTESILSFLRDHAPELLKSFTLEMYGFPTEPDQGTLSIYPGLLPLYNL